MSERRREWWDWVVAYLIPRPVWAWWTRNIYVPLRHRLRGPW